MRAPKGKYVFHQDAGHGWLCVKRAELERLGIANQISRCSYERGASVYLEEDDDAEKFQKAKRAIGEPVECLFTPGWQERSPVRSYAHYTFRPTGGQGDLFAEPAEA